MRSARFLLLLSTSVSCRGPPARPNIPICVRARTQAGTVPANTFKPRATQDHRPAPNWATSPTPRSPSPPLRISLSRLYMANGNPAGVLRPPDEIRDRVVVQRLYEKRDRERHNAADRQVSYPPSVDPAQRVVDAAAVTPTAEPATRAAAPQQQGYLYASNDKDQSTPRRRRRRRRRRYGKL